MATGNRADFVGIRPTAGRSVPTTTEFGVGRFRYDRILV